MNSEKKGTWYLYNSLTESRINALELGAALEILLKVNEDELEYWFAWKKEMSEWVKVEQLSEFKKELEKIKVSPPPPPPPPPFSGPKIPKLPSRQESQASLHSTAAKEVVFHEKRKHKRYNIELKVIFKKENSIFRTFTKNISLGGVALKNQVPTEFTQGECEVIISSPKWNENIIFSGRIAENLNNSNRVQFIESKEYFTEKLEQWLKELNYHYDGENKKVA